MPSTDGPQEGVKLVAARGRSAARTSAPQRGTPPAARTGGVLAIRERLTAVIEPVAVAAGFDLERVGVSRVGRRHRVEVVVDRDGGVGLDAIAEVSRAVSSALDTAEQAGDAPPVVPGEYVLEVSSPGVDRPLTEPRHWRRNVGRLVKVPVAGEGPVTGRVVAATGSGVTLEIDGATRELPYGRLGAGRVQVELHRLAEAGELDEPEGDAGELDDPGEGGE